MMKEIKELYRDERGVVVIIVGAIIALLLVFGVMALDASQMMLVRTQLQNAADAGCLAGIGAMALSGGVPDTMAAKAAAILVAGANDALISTGNDNVMGDVVITNNDVYFPEEGKICVTTHRTEATGDPFINYFLGIFDPTRPGEMTARACAEFFWVCSGKCLMPWAPPDRWFDANGNGEFDPDSILNPTEYYDPIATGYTNADLGAEITLVLGNGNEDGFGQFWYYAINFPPLNDGDPISGGDQYRDWMCIGCLDSSFTVEAGDLLVVEPGRKTGPNGQGLECIIDSDPDARWDEATGTVVNSAYPISPRIVKASFFDPLLGVQYDLNGRPYVTVVKVFVLFVESAPANDQIVGRFMKLNEPGGDICADQGTPTFLFKTALVE